MAQYLFAYDERDNTFPDRYRVIGPDDDAEFLQKNENLSGTVINTEAIAFLEELQARYQSEAAVRVEFVDAPHWRFIELRFNPVEAEAALSAGGKPSTVGPVT